MKNLEGSKDGSGDWCPVTDVSDRIEFLANGTGPQVAVGIWELKKQMATLLVCLSKQTDNFKCRPEYKKRLSSTLISIIFSCVTLGKQIWA